MNLRNSLRGAALLLVLLAATARAQSLPPCAARPTFVDPPWVHGVYWCLEEVIRDESAGELGFTALAAAPDGTLYAARPLTGEVLALTDGNGDGLPETARVALDGLTLPNGLLVWDGALYISGGAFIYRWRDGVLDVLADNLPTGGGFWTGGLTADDSGGLLVAVGAPCDACLPAESGRGAIWRFALDGSGGQMIADGLRQPGDVAFVRGALWTTDSARDGLADIPDLDELNRVVPGAFFGWPHCIGADNRPDLAGDMACGSATAPALSLPTHSRPLGLAAYTSDTFPRLKDTLLVVLSGSANRADLRGYGLAAVFFDEGGMPTGYEVIVPEQADKNNPPGLTLADIQYQGSGLWPRRPFDVTVSREGWVYFSVGGGRILALRPR